MTDDDVWDVRLEPVVVAPGASVGWVYFIACTETGRLKIGYTRGEAEKRLKSLQTGAPSPLTLIAIQPGTADTERALHERFAEQRLHGEWFKMNEAMFAYLVETLWRMAYIYSDHGSKPPPWMRAGLLMIREMTEMPLPDELEAML